MVTGIQPHRYHRVQALENELARSFDQTDVLLVTDIYGAGETPIEGVTGKNLTETIRARAAAGGLFFQLDDLLAELRGMARAGDIVLTVGAGDIWRGRQGAAGVAAPRSNGGRRLDGFLRSNMARVAGVHGGFARSLG